MARHSREKREEARRLYLTNEIPSVAEIARRVKARPHTIAAWKKEEGWDELRLKIDRRAAEKMVEQLANERVSLNAQHYKLWNSVVGKLFEAAQRQGLKSEDIRALERMANVLTQAQRGQRLARGLALDGQTEEQIRAAAEAESRSLIDTFIEVVKVKVPDETVRDEIAKALLARLPAELDGEQKGP